MTRNTAPRLSILSLVGSLLDLCLPAVCAACGSPGPVVCPACSAELGDLLFDAPTPVVPDPCPAGMPVVTACGPYAGPLRRVVTAYKDEDRRDLAAVLAPLLAQSVETALAGHRSPGVLLVPVPSSASSVRRRGDEPVTELARAAGRRSRPRLGVVRGLRATRRLADQAGLDHRQRAANLAGAYAVRTRWRAVLPGCSVLLVDDVVTTGATLVEASRALAEAGAVVVGAATVAATQRVGSRGRRPPDPVSRSGRLGATVES